MRNYKKIITIAILGILSLVVGANISFAATATFTGNIPDDGGDPNLYVWFQYGKTTNYGSETSHQTKIGTGDFTATVSGLDNCSVYHYRAVAKHQNFNDTNYGIDKTFTTQCSSSPTVDVNLEALPSSGASPLNNVDLKATVSGTAQGPITYEFDCQNDGNWEKITTQNSSTYTAYDLCNYTSAGTYTAKVRVERGGVAATDSAIIEVYTNNPNLTVVNDAKDLTQGETNYSSIVSAHPSDKIEFRIKISSNGDSALHNVRVKDRLPARIDYLGNLTIDGQSSNQSIIDGLSLGDFSVGESKTIIFQSIVEPEEKFPTGTTVAINRADAWGDNASVKEDSATVNITKPAASPGKVSVNKLVRNLSDGTDWANSVSADPGEALSFAIQVTAVNSALDNVIVKDVLPDRIIYRGNLKIDDTALTGDISSGLNIGHLSTHQTKVITFNAQVAQKDKFSFGETDLINTASAHTGSISNSDTATVKVAKKAVAGAATSIYTGITDNVFVDSFILPLIISLFVVWLFKAHIINFEGWLDSRKRKYQEYRSKKILQLKIAKARLQKKLHRE